MPSLAEIEASIRKLNRFFCFMIIPLLGVLLPNIAGLITNRMYRPWQLILSYAYFIAVAFFIWKGNVYFFRRIRKKYQQQNAGYFRMLSSYLVINILYSFTITIIFLFSWQNLSIEAKNWMPLLLYATAAAI